MTDKNYCVVVEPLSQQDAEYLVRTIMEIYPGSKLTDHVALVRVEQINDPV
jgi:hypothetical protein